MAILCSNIRIGIYYKRENENDRIKIDIGLLNGLIPIKIKIPFIESTVQGVQYQKQIEQKDNQIQQEKNKLTPKKISEYSRTVQTIKERTRDFRRILFKFMRKIKVVQFSWKSRFGTGDAAETGMLSGLAWIIKASSVAVINHFFQLHTKPHFQIEPSFSHVCFYTEIECIVKLRIGDAILTGILLYAHIRKGRKKRWENTLYKA